MRIQATTREALTGPLVVGVLFGLVVGYAATVGVCDCAGERELHWGIGIISFFGIVVSSVLVLGGLHFLVGTFLRKLSERRHNGGA